MHKTTMGGGHRTEITNTGREGHRIYFVNGGNNLGGDTAQHGKKKLRCGWVGVVQVRK